MVVKGDGVSVKLEGMRGGPIGGCDQIRGQMLSGHWMDKVVEEIALEGLDGITIQGLKVRLEHRQDLGIEDFEVIAPCLWSYLRKLKSVQFYLLPKNRPDLVIYDWQGSRDEKGNFVEPLHAPEEIYRYFPVEDKVKGIRGSCEHYDTRKDIGEIVRKCSYEQIVQRLGNRMVIVASQSKREQVLLGGNYRMHKNLNVVQYCIMERVGRARFSGEITRGKVSSTCLNIPPKTQFYMRKHLIKQGLIKRQSASVKFPNCKCPSLITVFHLPRFYQRIESIGSLNIRTIFSWLNNSDTGSVPVDRVVKRYGKHTMRALVNGFPTLVKTEWEKPPVHQITQTKPKKSSKKKKEAVLEDVVNLKEPPTPKCRAVRVVRLLVKDQRLQNQLIFKVLENPGEDHEAIGVASEPEEEGAGDTLGLSLNNASSYSDVEIFRPSKQLLFTTNLFLASEAVMRSGFGGLTQLDVGKLLKLTPLESRSAVRTLVKKGICTEGTIKLHKQRAFNYKLVHFSEGVKGGRGEDFKEGLKEKREMAVVEKEMLREMLKNEERKKIERRLKGLRKKRKRRDCKFQVEEIAEVQEVKSPSNLTSIEPVINEEEQESSPVLDELPVEEEKSPLNVVEEVESLPNLPTLQLVTCEEDQEFPTTLKEIPVEREKSPINPVQELESPPKLPSLILVTCEEDEESPSVSDEIPLQQMKPAEEDESPPIPNGSSEDHLELPSLSQIAPSSPEPHEIILNPAPQPKNRPKRPIEREDATDQLIRKNLARQRVNWTPEEDHFLLLAYIASSLFIPRYSYNRVFMYNSQQIRDLLLSRFGKSDKICAAIRRRLHFLLRQKQYFNWYLEHVGVALRDNHLYETLIKQYMPPPSIKLYQLPPEGQVDIVTNYLLAKFQDSPVALATEEGTGGFLKGIDTLLFLRQLKRTEFYWKAMQFAVFVELGDDGTGKNQFFERWRQLNGGKKVNEKELQMNWIYCRKFLKFVAKQCEKLFRSISVLGREQGTGFRLISLKDAETTENICLADKECTEKDINLWVNRCLILEQIFSGRGIHFQEIFKGRAKHEQSLLEKTGRLLRSGRILVRPKKTDVLKVNRKYLNAFLGGLPAYGWDEIWELLNYLEDGDWQNKRVDLLECQSTSVVVALTELMEWWTAEIKVGKEIFSMNVEMKEDENQKEVVVEVKEVADQQQQQNKGTKRKRKGKLGKGKKRRKKEDKVVTQMAVCFGGLSMNGDDKDKVPEDTVNASKKKTKKKKVGLEEGQSFQASCKTHSQVLKILRLKVNSEVVLNAGEVLRGMQVFDDHRIQINFPQLEFDFGVGDKKRSRLNSNIFGNSQPFGLEGLRKLREALVELVYHRVEEMKGQRWKIPNLEVIVGKYTALFELISLAGPVGLGGAYLSKVFEKNELLTGLRYLLECRLVFGVGVQHRRFVSYNNVEDWIIPICKAGDKGRILGHVVMRPWITAHGGLSWTTVNRLLTGVVGHLKKPEMRLDELLSVFGPVLSRVEALVLVEALAKLRYLVVYKVKEDKVGVFSKHRKDKIEIEYNVDTLVSTENVFVTVSPYVTILHAQLNHAIQRTSKKTETRSC